MIEIHVIVKGERVQEVEVSGHGGGKAGSDIVCAAVSAITETALAGLLHYGPKGVAWKMREGYISIQAKAASETSIAAIMTTMLLGLKQIEQEYPKRLRLHLIENTGIPDEA